MVYIPGFLINKVYERGSLQNTENGFEFCFMNRMTPMRISGMRDRKLEVDGVRYPTDQISLVLGGKPIQLRAGSTEGTIEFNKASKLAIRVAGDSLSDGKHVVKIGFITNEYGGATLKVSDIIGDRAKHTIVGRFKNWFSERGKPKGPQPIMIEGELGGVPLDPDFSRLEAALRREEPDRIPLFEAEIAMPIQEWFLGREINGVEDEIEFYIRAGYDYVPALPPFFTPRLMRTASDENGSLSDDDRERAWLTES